MPSSTRKSPRHVSMAGVSNVDVTPSKAKNFLLYLASNPASIRRKLIFEIRTIHSIPVLRTESQRKRFTDCDFSGFCLFSFSMVTCGLEPLFRQTHLSSFSCCIADGSVVLCESEFPLWSTRCVLWGTSCFSGNCITYAVLTIKAKISYQHWQRCSPFMS